MPVAIECLKELTIPHLKAFDLDPEFGLACLSVDGDDFAIHLNNGLLRSWRDDSSFKHVRLKWFACDQVVVLGPGYSTAVVSATNWRELERS